MAKKQPRARTARRRAERRVEKLATARRKLARVEPGATVDNPVVVASASQIDGAARSLRCALCDLGLFIEGERSAVHAGRVVRAVELRCRQCGEQRVVHFAVDKPLLS